METQSGYKRTMAGSVGAGMGAIFNASGRTYYILEHKTTSKYHSAGLLSTKWNWDVTRHVRFVLTMTAAPPLAVNTLLSFATARTGSSSTCREATLLW